jgi:hypothetical protein
MGIRGFQWAQGVSRRGQGRALACEVGSRLGREERPLSRFPLRGKAGAGGFPPRRQKRAAPPTRGVSKRSAETPLVHPPENGLQSCLVAAIRLARGAPQ